MNRTVYTGETEIIYVLSRKKVKNINLRVARDGTIQVSAGRRVPEKAIDAFVASKADWILRAQGRMLKAPSRSFFDGESLLLLGETAPVKRQQGKAASAALIDGTLILTLPDASDSKKADRLLDAWLNDLCAHVFEKAGEDAFSFFSRYPIKRPVLKTRRMKSRWGSCNVKTGVITLNKRLILVPQACIDYVMFHEYAHLIHPNHSAEFYKLLKLAMPDYERRRQLLRTYENVEM